MQFEITVVETQKSDIYDEECATWTEGIDGESVSITCPKNHLIVKAVADFFTSTANVQSTCESLSTTSHCHTSCDVQRCMGQSSCTIKPLETCRLPGCKGIKHLVLDGLCQIIDREVCKSENCNGHGQCFDVEGNARCSCNRGWIGSYCDTQDSSSDSNEDSKPKPQVIRVETPSNPWVKGSTYFVKWDYDGDIGDVLILLVEEKGSDLVVVATISGKYYIRIFSFFFESACVCDFEGKSNKWHLYQGNSNEKKK